MIAPYTNYEVGHGFFLGLTRPEDNLPYANLAISGIRSKQEYPNGSDGEGGRGAEAPTSSGSGQQAAQPQKPSKVCQNAQKRFRARQKERMSSLEREVATQKATFDQLSAENSVLRARTSILERVVSCRDEQLGVVQALEQRCRTDPSSQSCFGSSNTAADGNTASQEEFRKMKKEQVIPQYKAFLTEVSRLLLHCQYPCCDPTSPIVQQVTACVERMGYVMKHLVLLNSPLMRQLMSINLETMQLSSPPDSHWDDVVVSLQLGTQQRADILAVLDLYHGLLTKVYEERKLLKSALGDGVGTMAPTCTTFVSRNHLAVEMELMDRLESNLGKEHSANTLLSCFFFGKVLAPAQFAKVAVYSYPYFPDCLAVASAVARQHQGLPALGSSGSGSLHSH